MNFNSYLENASSDKSNAAFNFTQEDIAVLSHYPAIEKAFESNDLASSHSVKTKLKATFQNLERVVLRGSKDDAGKAQNAAAAIRIALEFIEEIERLKAETKSL